MKHLPSLTPLLIPLPYLQLHYYIQLTGSETLTKYDIVMGICATPATETTRTKSLETPFFSDVSEDSDNDHVGSDELGTLISTLLRYLFLCRHYPLNCVVTDPFTMTSLPPRRCLLLCRHYPLNCVIYYVVTTPSTVSSLTHLQCRHYPLNCVVTDPFTMSSLSLQLCRH